MKILQDMIQKDGKILPGGILKVDRFLNQQIDVRLIGALADEWKARFADEGVTKILTVEAAGIGIACIAAERFGTPAVFAKKTRSSSLSEDHYSARVVSLTHGGQYSIVLPKSLLNENDKVLIIDDLIANGSAVCALIGICREAGASVAGVGVAIEKSYLGGADRIRHLGYRVESLAKISSIGEDGVSFSE